MCCNVLYHAQGINEALPESSRASLDETVLRLLSHSSTGQLNAMTAMFGGVVGQEVVKAVSGKFHPLFQWYVHDTG